MKVIERDPRWFMAPINAIVNWLAVDTSRITSEAIAFGPWGRYIAPRDDPSGMWLDGFGKPVKIRNPWTQEDEIANQYQSHVWNAAEFDRWVYVDGKLKGRTWSWRPEGKDYKSTIILGYKLNGRFALTLRLRHTDAASAAGTTGPNSGQATGDVFGPA